MKAVLDDPMDSPAYAQTQASRPASVAPTLHMLADCFPGLELVEVVGHGGMGAVYQVLQKRLDRFAALKIIRSDVAADPAFTARFDREARTLARLSHPNIVGVYDFGEVPGPDFPNAERGTLFYFLMEYVDGVNLRQLIEAREVTPEQALSIVSQVCDALQYAHDEGVIHRDIKPENILLDAAGRVKIADFGLARPLGEADDQNLTATNQVLGTMRYMAPEQMRGSGLVDHRADIYSLGVVLYEMLTGETPAGVFAPPSKRVPIDVRLDDVVMKSLASDPDHRYQSVSEIQRHMEQLSGNVGSGSELPPSEAKYRGASTMLEDGVAAVAGRFRDLWQRAPETERQQADPQPAKAGYGFAELNKDLSGLGESLGNMADGLFGSEANVGSTDVIVPESKFDGDDFPDVCAVCGRHTERRQTKEFSVTKKSATPLIVMFMILFFPLGIAIAIWATKKMRVTLPVCYRHRNHWLELVLFASLGWVLIPLGAISGVYFGGALTFNGNGNYQGGDPMIIIPLCLAGIIAYVGPIIYLASTRVKSEELTRRGLRIQNVASAFSRAYREMH